MVYLDNAASTAMAPEALAAYLRAAGDLPGNPSSAHAMGAAAARAMETARERVATLVGAAPPELVFTSGGTEANALAVLGAAGKNESKTVGHLVVSAIEHPSVLRNAELLEERGWELTRVAPGRDGVVAVEAVLAAVRPETALVAIMLVNNELGTVQPIAEIASALAAAGRRAHLHVDAVQAAGVMPVDVRRLGAASLSLSAHKMHGPKGTGALWVRAGARLSPLWDGGRQERGLRSGTEDVPALVAFGEAALLARSVDAPAMARLRDRLLSSVMTALPDARPTLTGTPALAPHILSLALPRLPAEPILHALEMHGVVAAAGSACATRSKGPSHVLAALGLDDRTAVLRFSLSRHTTEDDVDRASHALALAVAEIAPVARRRRA
jgi:cysteine desulfurase